MAKAIKTKALREITYRKLADLKPYDRNPRDNEGAVDAVAESIKQFGFNVPIVIDKDDVIIAGHTRLKAAERLRLEEVPTIKVESKEPDSVIYCDKPMKCDLHPTMKPIKLIARLMINSSLKGDPVADIFGGSGSTLITCEQLGRRCFMMELDPHYCDVIIDRWEKFTGEKAKLLNG